MSKPSNTLQFSVRIYDPGKQFRPHCDRKPRLSFLVNGAFAEETSRGTITALPGDLLVKGNRIKHENRFGADGALLASIEVTDDTLEGTILSESWRLKRNAETFSESITLLEAALSGCQSSLTASVLVILASLHDEEHDAGPAPRWIAHLKDDLEEASLAQIDISKRAKEAGAHPVYASSLFRRHYGMSITDHTRHHSVRRAAGLLARDASQPLKDIALQAGFYDQSHMNRSFKRVTGRTPGVYRTLSVQLRETLTI